MRQGPLVRAFIASAPTEVGTTLDTVEDPEARLEQLVDEAAAAWPKVQLSAQQFVSWAAARSTGEVGTWLEQVHGPDLYLACACLHRDAAALCGFDEQFMFVIRELLQKLIPSGSLADDVAQALSQQLLLETPERAAALSQYNGQGRLQGWLRVSAVREAVRARRKAGLQSPSDDEALAQLPASGADPELTYMRELYRNEFREAFAEAVASLTPRDRTLLHYAVVDHLTVEDLGRIFRVHKASAARWVAAARETLISRTRRALGRRLGVQMQDQESILRLIQSQLDLSIRLFLDASGDDAG